MNYIKFLRQYVGHEPILTAGVGLFVFNENKEVLMQLRTDYNQWGFPGGAMELGESFEQTAKRELKEETSLDIIEMKMIKILSGEDTYREYPNGDKLYDITAIFVVTKYMGNVKVNDTESKKFEWFDVNNLPENMTNHTKKILNKYSNILNDIVLELWIIFVQVYILKSEEDNMNNKYDFFIAGRARNKENILKICDLFDKYKISYYCFLKNEDNWGYGNKNQTPEEKQKEFESLSLKSDIVLNLFHNDLEGEKKSKNLLLVLPAGKAAHIESGIAYGLGKKCYAIGEYDATDTLYNIFDEIFINETELEEFLKKYSKNWIKSFSIGM